MCRGQYAKLARLSVVSQPLVLSGKSHGPGQMCPQQLSDSEPRCSLEASGRGVTLLTFASSHDCRVGVRGARVFCATGRMIS